MLLQFIVCIASMLQLL